MKHTSDNKALEKGKEKIKPIDANSTPITREGYRSGRVADEFWYVLNILATPPSQRDKLQVLPFITKNHTHTEYLVDNSKQPFTIITTVHIAELLAIIPWPPQRARQHIVNKVAEALQQPTQHPFLKVDARMLAITMVQIYRR
jgi:hypothetical protein